MDRGWHILISIVLAAAFAGAALTIAVAPLQVLARTGFLRSPGPELVPLAWGIAATLLALAAANLAGSAQTAAQTGRLAVQRALPVALLASLPLLGFAQVFSHWWIDDAGITFAYSRSLAEGHGLVAQPWMPREEGYSSSLWMAILAGGHALGADIPQLAKALGIGCAMLASVLVALAAMARTADARLGAAAGLTAGTAPVVVWAASGQEHALQALLLVAAGLSPLVTKRWRRALALILALYVFVRPEAPLLVIGAAVAVVALSERSTWTGRIWEGVLIGLPALAAVAGLIAFRIAYFGDPFPNPYYAKASDVGVLPVLNLFAGGWQYVLTGLAHSGALLLVGLVAMAGVRRDDPACVLVLALVTAQIVFVAWAGGDWMFQARFLMPILPLIAFLAALALRRFEGGTARLLASTAAVLTILGYTVPELARARAQPSTPLAVVGQIGDTFAEAGRRLGVDDPLLAHHDAGAIAYRRTIRLLDLGGLLNRQIAQNMTDRAFLLTYIVEQQRPDFVFGARNFSARTGFVQSEAFAAAYVPLRFVDQPWMSSDLSYVRRDIVAPAPGITLVRSETGALVEVRVAVPGALADG
ncbi:MAG: hypothetical protein AAGG09_08410 [Pseudomonadota bacterium]